LVVGLGPAVMGSVRQIQAEPATTEPALLLMVIALMEA
jgi:hypothetical protein